MCASFCTFSKAIPQMRNLKQSGYEVIPILSEFAYATDTRFGKAADFIRQIEEICGKEIIHTIVQAEPIGPNGLLDLLLIAPCTGNTLGKLANSVTDTCITMSAKSHMRNDRPVVLAVSTNDGLSGNARNIGMLLNRKNVYFVPFSQDDPQKKTHSLIADFTQIEKTVELALQGIQLEPILL